MLEKLLALGHSGAEYDAWLIRINEGEQFSGFVGWTPIQDRRRCNTHHPADPVGVFESGPS